MALIPSESYSFPDDFVQTIADARKSAKQPAGEPPSGRLQPNITAQLFPSGVDSSNGSVDHSSEAKPKRHSLRNLIPSTLKKRMGKPSIPEENTENGKADAIPGSSGPLTMAPAVSASIWPASVEPAVQSDPAPFHPIEQSQVPAEIPFEDPIAPAETTEMRVIDSPSADLVQTLLARALFGSDPDSVQIPAPPQNGVTAFQKNVEPAANGNFGLVEPTVFAAFTPQFAQEPVAAIPKELEAQFEESSSIAFLPTVLDESGDRPVLKRQRSEKVRRFIRYEAFTLCVLVPLAILGLLRFFHDPIVVLVVDVITIVAAFAAFLMPILFFAATPQLPRGEE